MENKKVLKAGFWYTIVSFLTKGAVFLSTPLFTRMMSKADVGAFSNLTSWLDILIPLTTFDLATSLGIARFDYKEKLEEYMASILIYGTVITSVFYCIVLMNMRFFCDLFSVEPYMIHVMFIYLLVCPALSSFQSENMFKYKYKTSTVISLTSILVSIGLSLLLTYCSKNQLAGRIYGYYGVLIVFNIGIYLYILLRGKHVSISYFKYAFVISFPMIWHTLSLRLLTAGDRVVITHIIGKEANALYSVAYTCCHVISVLYGAMNNAWSPWSTERMNSGETEQMRQASKKYISFYSVIVVFAMLICPELLLIMGGKGYMEAKYVMPPVMVACVCQFIYSLYINAEFYLKKQTRIAIGTLLAAGINIGLNLIFVPIYGYTAAAYTTLAGYLCLFAFHFVSLNLLGKGDWYDNKFNITVIVLFIGIMLIINFLYANTVVRFIVFGVLLILLCAGCYKYKSVIKKYVRMILK